MFKNKYLRYALLLTCALVGRAHAQAPASASDAAGAYPNRPIRFVVAFAPGASTDIVGRIVGAKLAELWGQSVVIENRPGAGGNIGTQTAARANPDGYTILMNSSAFVVNVSLYSNPGYRGEPSGVGNAYSTLKVKTESSIGAFTFSGAEAYSTLMRASRTNSPQLCVSRRTWSVNSCGDLDTSTAIICLARPSFCSGRVSAVITAPCSLSITGLGVAAGANMPCQALVPMPG